MKKQTMGLDESSDFERDRFEVGGQDDYRSGGQAKQVERVRNVKRTQKEIKEYQIEGEVVTMVKEKRIVKQRHWGEKNS